MMEFFVIGKTAQSRADLKNAIQQLGGKLSTKLHEKLAAVISSEKEVERMNEKMKEAKSMGIQVITEDFMDKLDKAGAVEYIKSKSICDWGSDVRKYIYFISLVYFILVMNTFSQHPESRKKS